MRNFAPTEPPKDFDPRLVKILNSFNQYMQQVSAGFASLQRGEPPVSGGVIVGVPVDHHALSHLADYDDHPQYLYLAGRTGGQTVIGDPKTTLVGTDVGITIKAFNGPNTSSGPASFSILDSIVTTYAQSFFIYERGQTVGWQVNTGAGFASQQITGNEQITGHASGGTLFSLEHGGLGLATPTMYIKKRNSQSAPMLEIRDDTSGVMSYIRASDGAFVGVLSPTNTTSLLNGTYFTDVSAGSAQRGYIIVGNSSNLWAKLAPGANTYVLTSDGTDVSWQPGGSGHAILSTTHTDSTAASVSRGDLIIGQGATPKWERKAIGASGKFLSSDGTDVVWADPPAGSAHNILSSTHSDSLADTVVRGDVLVGNSTPKWSRLPRGSTGDVLTINASGDATWAAPSASSSHTILSSTHSDTVAASVVRGDLMVGNSTPAWARKAVGSSKQVVATDGTDTNWASLDNTYLANRTRKFFMSIYDSLVVPGTDRSNGTDTEVTASALKFSGSSDQFITFRTFVVPMDFVGSGNMFDAIKLYWATTTTLTTEGVVWQFGMKVISAGNDWRNAYTFGSVTTVVPATATDILVVTSLNLPALTIAAGDVITIKLWRKATNVGDTNGNVVTTTGMLFEYTADM